VKPGEFRKKIGSPANDMKTSLLVLVFSLVLNGLLYAQLTDNALREGDKADPAINPVYDYYEWENPIPEDCPFERSDDILKVKFTGRYANYTGADTWYLQSGGDGKLYSCWTDGTFFIGTYNAYNHDGYFNGFRYSKNWNHYTANTEPNWKNPYWTNAIDEDGSSAWMTVACNYSVRNINPHQCRYAASMHELAFVLKDQAFEELGHDQRNIAPLAKSGPPHTKPPAGPKRQWMESLMWKINRSPLSGYPTKAKEPC